MKQVSQNPQRKTQEVVVNVHRRTPRRALDKINALRSDAVHPATMQRYLIRWASWWHHVVGLNVLDLVFNWVCVAAEESRGVMWLGTGLLPLKWFAQRIVNV